MQSCSSSTWNCAFLLSPVWPVIVDKNNPHPALPSALCICVHSWQYQFTFTLKCFSQLITLTSFLLRYIVHKVKVTHLSQNYPHLSFKDPEFFRTTMFLNIIYSHHCHTLLTRTTGTSYEGPHLTLCVTYNMHNKILVYYFLILILLNISKIRDLIILLNNCALN